MPVKKVGLSKTTRWEVEGEEGGGEKEGSGAFKSLIYNLFPPLPSVMRESV